jgi:hypothetical protein
MLSLSFSHHVALSLVSAASLPVVTGDTGPARSRVSELRVGDGPGGAAALDVAGAILARIWA